MQAIHRRMGTMLEEEAAASQGVGGEAVRLVGEDFRVQVDGTMH